MKQQRTLFGLPLSWWIVGSIAVLIGCPLAIVIGLGITAIGSLIGPITIGAVILFAASMVLYEFFFKKKN